MTPLAVHPIVQAYNLGVGYTEAAQMTISCFVWGLWEHLDNYCRSQHITAFRPEQNGLSVNYKESGL